MSDYDEQYDENFRLKLISAVRSRPCIYDKKHRDYYNYPARQRAWMDIGRICGESGRDCHSRWKVLRERFCKEMKKIKEGTTEGRQWCLYDDMIFLKDSIIPRGMPRNPRLQKLPKLDTSNGQDESCEADESIGTALENTTARHFPEDEYHMNDRDEERETKPQLKRSRVSFNDLCSKFDETIESIENSIRCEDDEDETFLRAVLSVLRHVPLAIKDDFKGQMYTRALQLKKQSR